MGTWQASSKLLIYGYLQKKLAISKIYFKTIQDIDTDDIQFCRETFEVYYGNLHTTHHRKLDTQ